MVLVAIYIDLHQITSFIHKLDDQDELCPVYVRRRVLHVCLSLDGISRLTDREPGRPSPVGQHASVEINQAVRDPQDPLARNGPLKACQSPAASA